MGYLGFSFIKCKDDPKLTKKQEKLILVASSDVHLLVCVSLGMVWKIMQGLDI